MSPVSKPTKALPRPRFALNVACATLFAIVVVLLCATSTNARSGSTQVAICQVWKHRCYEALKVAYCESRFNVYARNGIYAGLFQVSPHWRRTIPGWGWSARAQARHALRIFKRTGHDWGEWECRP